ncbi:MAG: hypothetical protein PHH61_05985 [Candidatus Nanoarchaeia archaeon]|nr:hypothetical protein [Candidatus Nanoarchaeia archaeon]
MQNFFTISGIIFWYLAGLAAISFVVYLLVRDIPEPKGKTVDLTGIDFTYDSKGRKVKRRELHESMRKGGR